jgi:hypothetical protein
MAARIQCVSDYAFLVSLAYPFDMAAVAYSGESEPLTLSRCGSTVSNGWHSTN